MWATATAAGVAVSGAEPRRPNVLFVVVDDLDCRIKCFGDPVAITPNLDRLAKRGVRFDRAYCQYPLCNPTRSSVLSGRYPTTTGVLDNNTYLMLDPAQQTMPDYFAAHGYHVTQLGKIFHLQNHGMKRGTTKPEKPVGWFTPEERASQKASEPDYWTKNQSPYRNMKVQDPKRFAWANVYEPLPAGDRGDDAAVADKAIQTLESSRREDKPFFLAVGFVKPHVPLTAPKEFFDLYKEESMQLPPDFDTEPRHLEGMPGDEFRQNIDLFAARPFTAMEARQAMRAYYACVSYMDAQLGRVLDKLDQTGQSKNTIVVLWGDHGWHLSEKGMWAKATLFEVSARGPVIVADPRQPTAGQACGRVVEYIDMYPTLLELCGLPRAPWLEGKSFKPLLENPKAVWNKPAYTVAVRDWYIGRSVRNERWRYTEWDEGRRGAALFDHSQDPHEMRNLAQDPKQAAVVRELAALLRTGPVSRRP